MATLRDEYNVTLDNGRGERLQEQALANDMGSLRRGWQVGRIGNEMMPLETEALDAEIAGNLPAAQGLRGRIDALKQRQQMYTPEVNQLEQIHGIGDVPGYVAAQVGQGTASMLDPMAAAAGLGVVGRVAGAIPHPIAQGVSRAAQLGQFAVPYLMSKNQLTGEFIGNARDDKELMARTSPQALRDKAGNYGALAAIPDSALPGIVGRQVSGLSRAEGAVARSAAMGPGLRTGMGMLGEGGTEALQSEMSHRALGQLNPNRDTTGDTTDNWNNFAGGALGSGPFSAAGAYAEAGHNRIGAGVDAVKDATGSIIDMANTNPTIQTGVGAVKKAAGAARDSVIDLMSDDEGKASTAAFAENLKAGAADLKSKAQGVLEEHEILNDIPPANIVEETEQRKWLAENAPKRSKLIMDKLAQDDSEQSQKLQDDIVAAQDASSQFQALDNAAGYLIQNSPLGRASERANTLGENLGVIGGAVGAAAGRGAVAAGKAALGFGKAVLGGAREGMRKKNAQADETFMQWRDRYYGVKGQEAADNAIANAEQVQRAELAGNYAEDMAKRSGPRNLSMPMLAKHIAYSIADMIDTDLNKSSVEDKVNKLDRLTTDFHDIYRNNAKEVLTQLSTILGPNAGPAVQHMLTQLDAISSPQGRSLVASARDALASQLVALVAPAEQNKLMAQGINLNTASGREHVLSTMEDFADGISHSSGMRKALNNTLGADAVNEMMALLNGRDAAKERMKLGPIVDDREERRSRSNIAGTEDDEELSAFDKRGAEKEYAKGAGKQLYGFHATANLRTSSERRDMFSAPQKANAGEVVSRPKLFEKGQTVLIDYKHVAAWNAAHPDMPATFKTVNGVKKGVVDGVTKKIDDMKRQLSEDPEYPEYESHVIGARSAHEVMKAAHMQPGKILQLYRDYLTMDSNTEDAARISSLLAKVVRTKKGTDEANTKSSPEVRRERSEQAKAWMDANPSKTVEDYQAMVTARKLAALDEPFNAAVKEAEEYFKNRFLVVGDPPTNQDSNKIGLADVLELHAAGQKTLNSAKVRLSDEPLKAISDANILMFASEAGGGKEIAIPAGKLVEWVRRHRGMTEVNDSEDTSGKFANKDKDTAYLNDVAEGIATLIGSGIVKGLPYKVNAQGEHESFSDIDPKFRRDVSEAKADLSRAWKQFGFKSEPSREQTYDLSEQDQVELSDAYRAVYEAEKELDKATGRVPDSLRLATMTAGSRKSGEEQRRGKLKVKKASDLATVGNETYDGMVAAEQTREKSDETEGSIDDVSTDPPMSFTVWHDTLTRKEKVELNQLATHKERLAYIRKITKGLTREDAAVFLSELRLTNANGAAFNPEATSSETDDRSKTPLDFFNRQKPGEAKDDYADQRWLSRQTDADVSIDRSIGPETKMTAVSGARRRADAITDAYLNNPEKGQEMIRSRLRSAMRPEYSEDRNAAVGGVHYIAPLAAFISPENIARNNLDLPAKTIVAIRAKVAGVLMKGNASKDLKVGAARMMLGEDEKVTAYNVDGKLQRMMDGTPGGQPMSAKAAPEVAAAGAPKDQLTLSGGNKLPNRINGIATSATLHGKDPQLDKALMVGHQMLRAIAMKNGTAKDALAAIAPIMHTMDKDGSPAAMHFKGRLTSAIAQLFGMQKATQANFGIRNGLLSGAVKTLKDGMGLLSADPNTPEHLKIIARAVTKIAGNTKVTRSATLTGGATGTFDLLSGGIEIAYDAPVTSIASALLHEGVHAATVNVLYTDPALHQATYDLLNHVLTHNPGIVAAYGTTNTAEFLAEGMSNPYFQRALLKIPASSAVDKYLGKKMASAWHSLVALVCKALNIGASEQNSLTQLLSLGGIAMKDIGADGLTTVTEENVAAYVMRPVADKQEAIAAMKEVVDATYDDFEANMAAIDAEIFLESFQGDKIPLALAASAATLARLAREGTVPSRYVIEQIYTNMRDTSKSRLLPSRMSTEIHAALERDGFAAAHDSPIKHEGKFDWRAHQGKGEGNASFGAGTYLSTADGVHRSYKEQFTERSRGDDVGVWVNGERKTMSIDQDNHSGEKEWLSDDLTDLELSIAGWVADGRSLEDAKDMSLKQREYWFASSERALDAQWLKPYRELIRVRKALPAKFEYVLDDGGDDLVDTDTAKAVKRWNSFVEATEKMRAALDSIKSVVIDETKSPTYHVSVGIKPAQLMDWNAPLSEQSKLVQGALANAVTWRRQKAWNGDTTHELVVGNTSFGTVRDAADTMSGKFVVGSDAHGEKYDTLDEAKAAVLGKASKLVLDGKGVYQGLVQRLGSQAKASDYLQSLGILGHKFNASGGVNETHPNYVIYDDSKITTNYVHFNAQAPSGKVSSQAERDAAVAYAKKVLGPKISVLFKDILGYSGEFIDALNAIEISTTAAAGTLNTLYHEAMHVFFRDFVKANPQVQAVFESLINDPKHLDRLTALLDKYPAAQAQLSSGEERLAYTYQFWKAGLLEVDTKAHTWLQKLGKFFRRVAGMVRDSERALELFEAFDNGKMSEPSAAGKVIAAAMSKGTNAITFRRKMDAMFQGLAALTIPSAEILGKSVSPTARKLSTLFFTNPGEEAHGTEETGLLNARRSVAQQYVNTANRRFEGLGQRDMDAVQDYLQSETALTDIPLPEHREAVKDIRQLLDRFHKYMTDAGMTIGKIENYYPTVWHMGQLMNNQKEFMTMLVTKYAAELSPIDGNLQKAAYRIWESLVTKDGVDAHLPAQREDGVLTPFFASQEMRTLPWLKGEDKAKYLEKNMPMTLTRYFNQGAHATEYFRRFGKGGKGLEKMLAQVNEELSAAGKEMLKRGEFKTEEQRVKWVGRQMRDISQSVGAMEGSLGKDVSPNMRKFNSWMTVYQNIRLLPMALFSSFVDPLALVARGAPFEAAYETFVYSIREVFRNWADAFKDMPPQRQKDEWRQLAEHIGASEIAMFQHHVSEEYASAYMTPGAKKINDKMFTFNGMEAWNRGSRIMATKWAVRFIEKHSQLPDKHHSARWLKELGLTPAMIPMDDGKLITTPQQLAIVQGISLDEARKKISPIHDAINRWVEGAVLTPNAAQRPAWSSDPNFATMFHLKQFSYSFHQTILKRATNEFNHGNMAPLGALAAFIPTMIGADLIKGLIQGGGSLPPYMASMNAGDWVMHGTQRAGLSGIGVIGMDAATDWASLGGPAFEQIVDAARDGFGSKSALNAMPLHSLYGRLAA